MIETTNMTNKSLIKMGKKSDLTSPRKDLSRQHSNESQLPGLSSLQAEELRLKQTLARRTASQAQYGPTQPLDGNSLDIISILSGFHSGFKIGAAVEYVPIPWQRRLLGVEPGAACWRIELHGLATHLGPVGLDILDDVVIGRGSEADVDLESYRGYEKAVSRRHAMLRPTRRQLHLIDLGSTNGTLYNSIPLGHCATYALKSNDVITLGLQTFTIKIVDGPLVANT